MKQPTSWQHVFWIEWRQEDAILRRDIFDAVFWSWLHHIISQIVNSRDNEYKQFYSHKSLTPNFTTKADISSSWPSSLFVVTVWGENQDLRPQKGWPFFNWQRSFRDELSLNKVKILLQRSIQDKEGIPFIEMTSDIRTSTNSFTWGIFSATS